MLGWPVTHCEPAVIFRLQFSSCVAPSNSALCCWRKVHIHENRVEQTPQREDKDKPVQSWARERERHSTFHTHPFLFAFVCVRGITTLETKWPFSVLHKPESTPPNWIVEAFAVNAQELTFGASDRYADILRVQWQACEEKAGSRAGGSSRRPEGWTKWRGGGKWRC